MSETKAASGGLTRRSFLKTTGAVAGAAALGGALSGCSAYEIDAKSEGSEVQNEEVFSSFCRCNCGSGGCTYNLTVREGNVVAITPRILADADPETKGRTRSCFKGLSNMQRQYSNRRLLYPVRRAEGTERGAGEWERITWDEALDDLSEKWQSYINEFGGESIAMWTTFGNLASLHGATGVCWSRLQYFLGLSTLETGADWAGMYAAPQFIGGVCAGTNGPGLMHAKNYIAWGANPAESWLHEWRYVCDARENGCKLYVVDPRVSVTAAKADRHFALRPGSDTALGLGICRYLIDNDLLDETFMKASSDAPLLVRQDTGAFLKPDEAGLEAPEPQASVASSSAGSASLIVWDEELGACSLASVSANPALEGTFEVNGLTVSTVFTLFKERVAEWTVDHTAEVCGLTAQEIIDLAEIINDGPTVIHTGYGFGHMVNSHAMIPATIAPLILTGNFGKPGCGYGMTTTKDFAFSTLYGYPERDTSSTLPAGSRGPRYSDQRLWSIMETGEYAGKPAVIKSVIVHSANPFGNTSGRTALMDAVSKIEYVVVVDQYLSDTAQYADLVLPAAFWFEENDAYSPSQFPYVFFGGKAVDPLGESKSDLEICSLIAGRMGYGDYFQDDEETVLRGMVDGCTGVDVNGNRITYDRMVEEREIRVQPDDFYDGADGTYKTSTGRVQLYLETPKARLDYGDPIDVEKLHMAYFEPPHEAWPESVGGYEANPLAEKYPLVCYSIHQRWNTHTTYRNIAWIQELMPDPVVSINPKDASDRGIADGDLVRVFNDRGNVVIKARLDAAMRPGSVNIPHGWQGDQFVEGHYADLSSPETNPFDANACYYDALCQVELYEGSEQ